MHSIHLPGLALGVILTLLVPNACLSTQEDGSGIPLRPLKLRPLPLGTVRPAGWLERQLRIQADGLTGHLDEFWPDIRDSGWTGGRAEGWERLPYWLDGLVPIAYLLDDPVLKRKSSETIDYILSHQAEDGWLGPGKSPGGKYKSRDPWPVFVLMKALTQYCEATGDGRVPEALARFLLVLREQLNSRPLFDWNRMRWQDGVLTIHWLFDRKPESWLLLLAEKMKMQGYDWTAHFDDLPYKSRVSRWEHESHVVNNAMGAKAPGVWFRQSGNPDARQIALGAMKVLDRYHGQVSGIFSGDECLSGKMPSQGTETCAVVEYLFSLEVLASIFADPELGDRMERVAFNALPAPFKPDMWARQYIQQANQPIVRVSDERIYTTNGSKANLFGLETNYGCCTANMHQGWPKFASHLWMATEDQGVAAVAYAPSSVSTVIRGTRVDIALTTDYPFREDLSIEIRTDRPIRFPLWLRIPSWSAGATIGIADEVLRPAAGRFERVEREWQGRALIRVKLPMPVRIERRFNRAVSVSRGPLVFSLRIGEDWQLVGGEVPHGDWEVYPTTPWNYALEIDPEMPEESVRFEFVGVGENPFRSEEAPIVATVRGRRLAEWQLERNAAAAPPSSPVRSAEPLESLELIPYGAAKLRITEFPTLD